jgi:hypothetical protein
LRSLLSSLLSIASYSYFFIFAADYQQELQRPSNSSFSADDNSSWAQSTLNCLTETNLPHTQHQFLHSFYLNTVWEIEHSCDLSWALINANISGWVVKSFAVCPLEFLQSNKTPSCRNFLNIYGKLPAADSITLLLPQLSISYQWTPVFIRSWTIGRCPLKQAQCRGFGLIYLVLPITTVLSSGLIYKYCCAAPRESINLTMRGLPIQHAQIKAVHRFLLFSKCNEAYLSNWDLLFFWDNVRLLHTRFSWRMRWVFR